MKIELIVENVAIRRAKTVGEALKIGLNEKGHGRLKEALLHRFHLDRIPQKEAALARISDDFLLYKDYEGEDSYRRTMALAIIAEEKIERQLRGELKNAGYYPASLSEGMAYLSAFRNHSFGQIIHLGACILDDELYSCRIITTGHDQAILERYYGRIRQKYAVIVVKEEEKPRK